MFNIKTAFAAAAMTAITAAITVAGTVSASADPYGRHLNRVEHRLERRDARIDHRIDRIDRRIDRHERRMIDHARVHRVLWTHHYQMIGQPYYLGSRYVVRGYDRFGRVALVRIDPWTGAFMGTIRF